MKRSPMPRGTTPLKATVPLGRKTPLQARVVAAGGKPPRMRQKRHRPAVADDVRAVLLNRSGGWCEADVESFPKTIRARISVQTNGCIHWTGWRTKTGYCQVVYQGRYWFVHRLVLALLGEDLDGWIVDHECHNRDEACIGGAQCEHRRCVNPSHLRLTTRGQNTLNGKTTPAANLAKARCACGRPYDWVDSRGWRKCRTCENAKRRERRRARRTAATEALDDLRKALKERSGGECEMQLHGCHGRGVDPAHRISVKAGGRRGVARELHNRPSNALWACRACHDWCHARPAEAYDLGLMLKEHRNPLQEPVVRRGELVYLDDDGGIHLSEVVGS